MVWWADHLIAIATKPLSYYLEGSWQHLSSPFRILAEVCKLRCLQGTDRWCNRARQADGDLENQKSLAQYKALAWFRVASPSQLHLVVVVQEWGSMLPDLWICQEKPDIFVKSTHYKLLATNSENILNTLLSVQKHFTSFNSLLKCHLLSKDFPDRPILNDTPYPTFELPYSLSLLYLPPWHLLLSNKGRNFYLTAPLLDVHHQEQCLAHRKFSRILLNKCRSNTQRQG